MPIPKELRHFYRTESWYAARARCLERAQNRCEHCHLSNGALGWRDRVTKEFHHAAGKRWKIRIGTHKLTRILLTVAHKNHTPGDDRDENLLALCLRCHLRYDLTHHCETRATRKDRARPIFAMLSEASPPAGDLKQRAV